MDDESRTVSAIQLRKAFDLQLSQSSAMVTSQHRENPLHNNQETDALHFRESALHVAKHLSKGIKQASGCLLRQSCHNAYKQATLLGKGGLFFVVLNSGFSSNWFPPSLPASIHTADSHLLKLGLSCQRDPAQWGLGPCLGYPGATDTHK